MPKRIDNNHKIIRTQLRQLGFSVEDTFIIGKGFPDFIIGFNGLFTIPVEIKSKRGKLNDKEEKWHKHYKGYVITAYNTEDVLLGVSEFFSRLTTNKKWLTAGSKS